MTRAALCLLLGCSGSTSGPADAALVDAMPARDGGVFDSSVDAFVVDSSVADAGVSDATALVDSGADVLLDPDGGPMGCDRGIAFMGRCIFTVRSRTDEANPCPVGARRLRWANRAEQQALQAAIAALEIRSGATSLRRRARVGEWVWDDNTPAPGDLFWAVPPGTTLPNAFLNSDGLNAYHREYSTTFCEE